MHAYQVLPTCLATTVWCSHVVIGNHRGGVQCAAAGLGERDPAPLGRHQQQEDHPTVPRQERQASCLCKRHFKCLF